MSEELTNCLFQRRWWLDAVAPGAWDTAVVERNGEVVARMPYVMTRRYGLRCVNMPKLTPTLGPCLKATAAKPVERTKQVRDWLGGLIDQLPAFDWFCQSWHPSAHNWMPFYWRGFRSTTNYTYLFPDLTDVDALRRGYHESTRRQVKKARRSLTVRDDLGFDAFWRLNQLTYQRQGRTPPYPRALVQRIDEACEQHGARKIFFAQDAAGEVHAALYLVWDERSAYYLMSGSDPELRNSGALSLLMDHAIEFTAGVSRAFDFEGSMQPAIERFVRNFGAEPKPYLTISGQSRRMNVIQGFRGMFHGAAA